jgi:SAM-dependent methyltransferase
VQATELLQEVSDFCRRTRMAETTFGRRAVNDGKFVNRLRYGGRVTTVTVERVRAFIADNQSDDANRPELPPEQNFRFFDNRQKYLMFVNTCSEKWAVANRVAREFAHLRPAPPALRLFDAGTGDGTVLAHVLRALHRRYEKHPFYVVGKEISLEDVRLALAQTPDRFFEHPATVVVMTNLPYADAPWLAPRDPAAAARLIWREVALAGSTAAEFEEQISELGRFLTENWRARVSKATGRPAYEKPVVLVLYRDDCRFALDAIIPRPGAVRADFDLVIASQPYRARAPTEFKAGRIIAPLARALAPGGRLVGVQSCGGDPGLEIVQKIWPGDNPFQSDRRVLMRATREALGRAAHNFQFLSQPDEKALFRYHMHTVPGEIERSSPSIGTSTLLAAWNASTYVAQIEDPRLALAMHGDRYLRATHEVLQAHGGLWFVDESFIIARKRDLGR